MFDTDEQTQQTYQSSGSLFDLMQGPSLFSDIQDDDFMSASLVRPMSKRMQRVQDELEVHKVVMHGIAEKVKLAQKERTKLRQFSVGCYSQAITTTQMYQAKHLGQPYQRYMDEFNHVSLQLLGRNLLGFEELAAAKMGREMRRCLYLPPEKPSFWKRNFGGGE